MTERANESWTADANRLCQIALVALTIIAPAINADDAWLFNYLNNVEGARPLFYNNGYVHLIPQVTGYAVSDLPLIAQAVLYRAVPLFLVLCLYRELRDLFSWTGARNNDAWMPAIAIMLVLRVTNVDLFGNLSYSTWLAFLAACTHVVRLHITSQHYSILGCAGVITAAVSLPLGLLLVPLCALHAIRSEGTRRRQDAAIALATLAAYVLFASGLRENPLRFTDPITAVQLFVMGFRQNKLDNLIATVSILALLANIIAFRTMDGGRDMLIARWSLSYVGLMSFAVYVVSDRFLHHGRGFDGVEPRFALPALTCALMLVGLSAVTRPCERERARSLGAGLGAAVALVAVLLFTQLRGPLETALMRYRFLEVAANFREWCRDGDAMLYEANDSSPAVLCRPQQLPLGFYEMRHVPPTIGAAAAPLDDPPGFFVYRPLW
jgi:hypothetical protein